MTTKMHFSVTDREWQTVRKGGFCGSWNFDLLFGLDMPLKRQPQMDQVTSLEKPLVAKTTKKYTKIRTPMLFHPQLSSVKFGK